MSNTAPSSKLIPRLSQSARIIAAALGLVRVGYRPAEHLQAAADSKHRHAAMSMSRRSPDVSRSDRLSSSSMSTLTYGTTPAQGIFTRSYSISSPLCNIDTSPRNLLITVALTLAARPARAARPCRTAARKLRCLCERRHVPAGRAARHFDKEVTVAAQRVAESNARHNAAFCERAQ